MNLREARPRPMQATSVWLRSDSGISSYVCIVPMQPNHGYVDNLMTLCQILNDIDQSHDKTAKFCIVLSTDK